MRLYAYGEFSLQIVSMSSLITTSKWAKWYVMTIFIHCTVLMYEGSKENFRYKLISRILDSSVNYTHWFEQPSILWFHLNCFICILVLTNFI